MRKRESVCVRERARERVCVCVRVCVSERESKRKREHDVIKTVTSVKQPKADKQTSKEML